MRPPLAAAMLAVLPGAPLAAQDTLHPDEGGEPVAIGHTMTIHSDILGEDRRVYVQLPAGYELDPEARYPVIYQLDGEVPGPFAYMAGLVGFLSSGYQLPEMIVVGVPNTERTRDLTPPHDGQRWFEHILIDPDSVLHPGAGAAMGGADAFLSFLTEELTPEIERRYRTAPFRVLVGHSLGGLFVTNALLTRPESFQAYIASSPSLTWNDRALVRDARRALARLPDGPLFFYVAAGDHEVRLSAVSELATVLEMHAPPGLRWWYRVNPGETHQSNPVPTYSQGLSTLFADLALPEGFLLTGDLDALEARYAKASRTYGYRIPPPAGFLVFMGANQLLLGRTAQAIGILERTVELHPASADAWDALAGALEAEGRLAEALARSEEAVRRAAEVAHPRLEAFTRRRDGLRSPLSAQEPTRADPTADAIDRLVHAHMESREIPGLALVMMREGEVLKQAAYGRASLDLDAPVTSGTIFPYASMAKVFAATAILRLVGDGHFGLDDAIGELLPGLPDAWSSVTVRQLLSNTSGLPDMNQGRPIGNPFLAPSGSRDDILAALGEQPVAFGAAEGFAYNQTNYLLLGMLLEQRTGQGIEDHVREEIAEPLGLESLTYGDSRDVIPGRVTSYTRMDLTGDAPRVGPVRPLWTEYPPYLHMAAGLNGTALDLARFVDALARGRVLGGRHVGEMWTAASLADGSVFRFEDGVTGAGLGWWVHDAPAGRWVAQGGAASGYLRHYVDEGLTIVVLTNLQGAEPEALVEGIAESQLSCRGGPGAHPSCL